MRPERRKYPRHEVANNAVFILDRFAQKVAMLKDLSFGGMHLRYLPCAFTDDHCVLIDLVAGADNRVLVRDLSCNRVYDVPDLMENGSFRGMDVRRCGVRFERLTDAQKEHLHQMMDDLPLARVLTETDLNEGC